MPTLRKQNEYPTACSLFARQVSEAALVSAYYFPQKEDFESVRLNIMGCDIATWSPSCSKGVEIDGAMYYRVVFIHPYFDNTLDHVNLCFHFRDAKPRTLVYYEEEWTDNPTEVPQTIVESNGITITNKGDALPERHPISATYQRASRS